MQRVCFVGSSGERVLTIAHTWAAWTQLPGLSTPWVCLPSIHTCAHLPELLNALHVWVLRQPTPELPERTYLGSSTPWMCLPSTYTCTHLPDLINALSVYGLPQYTHTWAHLPGLINALNVPSTNPHLYTLTGLINSLNVPSSQRTPEHIYLGSLTPYHAVSSLNPHLNTLTWSH